LFDHGIVLLLGFCGWDIADGFEQPPVVEPVDPFESGIFDGLERSPRSPPVDDLGFVKAIDGLGQSVVIAVADTTDGWLNARFGEAFGILDRDVLAAAIGVVDETAAMRRSTIMKGLLERIEDEAGMGRAACPPPDDPPCERVDDERDIHEPRPGGDIGEVRDPEHVGRWCAELPVDVITRARRRAVAYRGLSVISCVGGHNG
jgi:hypothetical protein